jgi:alkylation response protein AidB-like acyl-CoA dehydrogenase
VDFRLDETQQAVADLAATVLRNEADSARVEHVLDGEPGYDETLWKAMAQAGLLGLAVPEFLGGDGFGAVVVGCVLREVGRQTLPVPALATLALGVLPIVALGSAEQQRDLLPDVADGRVLSGAIRDAGDRPTIATEHGGAYQVTGTKVGVPFAAQADRILVPTTAGVLVLDPHADGVTLTRTPTSTKSAEYTVALDDVAVPRGALLTPDVAAFERFALAGAVAAGDGVIAGALALTAAHLGTRHQFGKPLATFQAVAQQIADVYVTAQTMHLTSTSVLWRLDEGLDAADDADIAAYWLAAELPTALQVCHHLHGGLGVDYSYPLHRYYSQAKDLARFVGGSEHRLRAIGDRCTST